jgi:glycosyltransferase involved in cell wall biosynthesis
MADAKGIACYTSQHIVLWRIRSSASFERNVLIRIAFVIPTLDQSGAERQLTLLAMGLPRDEFSVHVIALNRGGPFAEELRAAGISVEVLGKRFRFDPLTYLRLRNALRAFKPDIVQSFLFAANSYVRLPGIAPANCQVVVSERCVDSWKSGWQLAMDRRLIDRTNAMTANSASVASFYEAVGVRRNLITVIPNAIPSVPARYTRDQAREILGLRPEDRVVGFSGRLAPQKRLPDLIWAFQLLHQVVENARLVIVGEGPERDSLTSFASQLGCRDKTIFAGHRADSWPLLTALDAFVLPSEFEGMSNSLMEAMSLGVPCVASDIAPNLELITNEETGLIFPLGKSPELTKALVRVLQPPELAAKLGNAGRQLIETQHSVDQMVNRHRALYNRLLNAGK